MTTSQPVETTSPVVRRELWLERAGARLFAVVMGEGRPFVFIHGGLADHRAALFRVGGLAGSLQLIVPDLRGSGRSIHTGPLSWDTLADDVDALLTELGVERAVVGGVSMGSGVALRFALRHPRRLRGLVLMSPVYPGADRPLSVAAAAAMRTMAEVGERALSQGVEAILPLFERLPAPVREVAVEMARGFDPASVAATTRFLATNEQPFGSVSELSEISAPVLLVPGTDPEHPAELATLHAQHLRDPRVVEAQGPELTAQIARFVDDLR